MNLNYETIHNTAESTMEHIFPNGTRVLTDWKTKFVYLLNEAGKTIEKNPTNDFTIQSYEQYLQRIAEGDRQLGELKENFKR